MKHDGETDPYGFHCEEKNASKDDFIQKCSVCGCTGNESCGNEPPVGHGCELDECLVCSCCNDMGIE
jgi:hypothetical protein